MYLIRQSLDPEIKAGPSARIPTGVSNSIRSKPRNLVTTLYVGKHEHAGFSHVMGQLANQSRISRGFCLHLELRYPKASSEFGFFGGARFPLSWTCDPTVSSAAVSCYFPSRVMLRRTVQQHVRIDTSSKLSACTRFRRSF